jgi:iron complex outermembrane receptor protein
MKLKRCHWLALASLTTSLAFAGETQTTDPTQLDDMVVTASRSAEQARNVAANVTVITAADIDAGNYSDVVSVLKQRAGLHFRSGFSNQEASVDIRGFGENSFGRVLILRDGRKLNRPDQRSLNWEQIPLANIDRIEIIRGANSALYGDQAVGGVINIITKKGGNEPSSQVTMEGGSESFNRQALSTTGSLSGLNYALSLQRKETAGWRDRTGARTEGGDLSLGYVFSDGLRLDANLNLLNTDYEMPGPLTEAEYDADPTQAANDEDEARENYIGFDTTLTAKVGDNGQFLVDLGYLKKEIETDTIYSWGGGSWTNLDLETWSVSPRYVLTAPMGNLENRMTLGVDWTYDSLYLERYNDEDRSILNGTADVSKNSLGVYLNDALHLHESLILSTGARLAASTYAVEEEDGTGTVTDDEEDTHREQAYHLGLTWLPRETTKLFAKYEHFYRFPFTDEQICYSGYGTSSFNKDLKAETGNSFEIGVEQQLPGAVTLAATLFHMEMQDEISTDYSSISYNSNLDDTLHQGLELSLRAEPDDRISLYMTYTYQNVEFASGDNEGNEIPLVPKHKLGGGIELRPLKGLRVSLDATHTSSMVTGGDNANTQDRLDDYTVVDLGLAYTFRHGDANWEVFGGVDNLFDEEYAEYGFNYGYGSYYYPASGRTCKAGLKIAF